jgi:hypothetical protein
MNDPKQEASSASPANAAPAEAKGAEKVRSSRYEWERAAGDKENRAPGTRAARSLMTWTAWLKKFFSWDFFDKDDDATPSAA